MNKKQISIMIGGEAGQGLVTIGDLLVRCLARGGYNLLVTQDYLSRIRGGQNAFVVRTGLDPVLAPCESVDILVALSQETVEHRRGVMSEDGVVIVDSAFKNAAEKALRVPFQELTEKRYWNVAALGVTGAVLGLEKDLLADALNRAFGKKHPESVARNLEALDRAFQWCQGKITDKFKLEKVQNPAKRLALNGNEAIALGALAAGVKFCAFYPMTPSTSIALNLAARAEKMGLAVEQAEDEIAAINMAVGASFAGAPSLVTTSGGGFALMGEGVSLAAMTETPLVVAVVQRPGPATGLPTRTEQGDLELVLYSGHGEFPRAVFAPGDVTECFDLTRRAFDLAERFQGPMFVLSDQYLADSFRAVAPFDPIGPTAGPVRSADGTTPKNYQRYAYAENGVSPRLLPGLSEHLVVADSDEHTPDGHLTEDLEVRVKMNDKRLAKLEFLKKETLAPMYLGNDDPEILLVCWGSGKGPALEAAESMSEQGKKTAVLHFSQVWPLVPEQFIERLEKAGRVIVVEGNATGQLANLIRRESGFHIKEKILRYDGLALTPEYIERKMPGGK